MSEELKQAAQQALACMRGLQQHLGPDICATEAAALERALTQRPAAQADGNGVSLPDGWVPLTIEYEPGYPEAVAFGPQRMMNRLKKWLDKHFAALAAQRPAAQAGEREAFEAWAAGKWPWSYGDAAWEAWQARASLPTQPAAQATPEPVGEPVLYVSQKQAEAIRTTKREWYTPEGTNGRYLPVRAEPSGLFTMPLYATSPAPGVPDGFALVPLTDREMDAAIDKAKAETMYGTHHSGYWRDIGRGVLAAAQAKGGQA